MHACSLLISNRAETWNSTVNYTKISPSWSYFAFSKIINNVLILLVPTLNDWTFSSYWNMKMHFAFLALEEESTLKDVEYFELAERNFRKLIFFAENWIIVKMKVGKEKRNVVKCNFGKKNIPRFQRSFRTYSHWKLTDPGSDRSEVNIVEKTKHGLWGSSLSQMENKKL